MKRKHFLSILIFFIALEAFVFLGLNRIDLFTTIKVSQTTDSYDQSENSSNAISGEQEMESNEDSVETATQEQSSDIADDEIIESESTVQLSQNDDNYILYLREGTLTEDYFYTEQGIAELNELAVMNSGRYAYDLIDDASKELYLQVLDLILHLGSDVRVSANDNEELDFVFQCILSDHPEIFYIDGYTYTTYKKDNQLLKILVSGNYTQSRDEIEIFQNEIETISDEIIESVKNVSDDYLVVKYLYEYLIDTTEYQIDAKENQNILSVLLYHESVCQGYAKTLQYLLDKLGLESTLVVGSVDDGVGHAWNLVMINGNYYYVDATWGDAFYVFEDTESKGQVPSINYDYLCVTTEELQKTHIIDNPVSLPWCFETKDNYYVRENAYFTSVDTEGLTTLFQSALEEGNELVVLKCSDQNVYQEMLNYLIDEQAIFDYMGKEVQSISYAGDEVQSSITIWLNE